MLHEELRQRKDVLPAFRERGDIDGELVQAVEQVLPETSFGYRPLQVLVRGGHQTDVKGVFLGGADGLVASFLQGT